MPWWGWLLLGLVTGGLAMYAGICLYLMKDHF